MKEAERRGREEEVGERFQQFVKSGGSDETLNKLSELAQDPLYDPSKDPEFDPLEGSLHYQELPFYTEDPRQQDVNLNPLSKSGSFSSRLSRRKRDIDEGKYLTVHQLLSRSK